MISRRRWCFTAGLALLGSAAAPLGDPADTVDMIAEFGKLDPNLVRHMARAKFAPYLTAAMIQPLIDVAARYKVIDAGFNGQELISPYAVLPGAR